MFLMIGSAEKAGSGVNKIMAGREYAHWRQPYVLESQRPDRVVLELPMFSILPEETLDALRSLFGDEVDALGKDELTILATCHIEGDVTNSRLQHMVDRHRTDITKILQDLCKEGYLLSNNRGRWTTYHLNGEFLKKDVGDGANRVAEIIAAQPGIRTEEIAKRLGKAKPKVERYLRALRQEEKIHFVGATKTGGYYML